MVGSEAIYILVKVKHNGNTDNKQDGEEIGSQELAYQVSVYSF